jgi:hypothetical protein
MACCYFLSSFSINKTFKYGSNTASLLLDVLQEPTLDTGVLNSGGLAIAAPRTDAATWLVLLFLVPLLLLVSTDDSSSPSG